MRDKLIMAIQDMLAGRRLFQSPVPKNTADTMIRHEEMAQFLLRQDIRMTDTVVELQAEIRELHERLEHVAEGHHLIVLTIGEMSGIPADIVQGMLSGQIDIDKIEETFQKARRERG